MKSDFLIALTQLAAERNLPRDMVIQAIEAGLVSAYRRDSVGAGQNIMVRLNPASGEIKVFTIMEVMEKVEDPKQEMTLADARKLDPKVEIGGTVEIETTAQTGGRIAAQTAKQVVMQRLREAERELVFAEYTERADEIVSGTIQRMEPRQIIVDLGRAEAVLPEKEQVPTERYRLGQRLKVYIVEVRRTTKGPEIVVSRSHKNLLRRLFEMEVPEIFNGIVEIKAVAREAGSRSKVAVWARQDGVDPVGSCVGLRGIRIQNIVNELQGEKIDVMQWNRDLGTFISNALSPSQPQRVELNEAENVALVVVPDKQLSLAIGREGQNVRLAAKLTDWKVDIKSSSDAELERLGRPVPEPVEDVAEEQTSAMVEQELVTEVPVTAADVVEVAVEVEVAVAEEEVTSEAVVGEVPALSAEEELAVLSLQEGTSAVEEEEEGISPSDDVWEVPELVSSQGIAGIRFAEDIMAPREANRGGRGRRRGKDDGTKKALRSAARKNKAPVEGQRTGV